MFGGIAVDTVLSSEFLKRVLDESDLGVVVTDLSGDILSVSEKLVALTGYSESELIGANPRIFRSGHTPCHTYKHLWSTIQMGSTWRGPILNRRKDGTLFLDRETIVSGSWPMGTRPCFVAIHRDASLEMQLRLRISNGDAKLSEILKRTESVKSDVATLVGTTEGRVGGATDSLLAALEARDPFTARHGRRTATLIELVGEDLDLFSKYAADAIRTGAILHDIGKMGVPDSILWKQGPLAQAENEVMMTHAVIGFEILRLASPEEETIRIVRHHHERLDGSGYPDGLRGPEIPDYVRAFSVCDSYDAMTISKRYGGAMLPEAAISILTDEALLGRLDMAAVQSLRRLWERGAISNLCADFEKITAAEAPADGRRNPRSASQTAA